MSTQALSMTGIRWARAAAGAVGAKILMLMAAFGWVAIYSHLIHPGETAAYYQAYAQKAVPYVAVVVAVPLFFALGRWLRRRVGEPMAMPTAWALWGIYLLMDVPFILGGAYRDADPIPCVATHVAGLLMVHLGATRGVDGAAAGPVS